MMLARTELFLKVTGLCALALGLVLQFADLRGWLADSDKVAVYQWILTSTTGLPIEHSGARKFMKTFPPPDPHRAKEITHLTKQVIRPQNGPVQNASINYMYRDTARSAYVATLAEVAEWSRKTWYPYIAWVLSVIGFVEVSGGFVIERRRVGNNRGKTTDT